MSDPEPAPGPAASFAALTPRQRRLRALTVIILAFILVMIVVGLNHPFFHLVRPPNMTPTVRKALAVRGIMILGYWTICFLLAACLPLLAWLDVREVRRKMLVARRDMWKEIAEDTRARLSEKRTQKPPAKPEGSNGAAPSDPQARDDKTPGSR